MPDIVDGNELWCKTTVVNTVGTVAIRRLILGRGSPDLGAVAVVARLALRAKQKGHRVVLSEVCPELRSLLRLVGLPFEVEEEPSSGD